VRGVRGQLKKGQLSSLLWSSDGPRMQEWKDVGAEEMLHRDWAELEVDC
jgi:hypothetical protein